MPIIEPMLKHYYQEFHKSTNWKVLYRFANFVNWLSNISYDNVISASYYIQIINMLLEHVKILSIIFIYYIYLHQFLASYIYLLGNEELAHLLGSYQPFHQEIIFCRKKFEFIFPYNISLHSNATLKSYH